MKTPAPKTETTSRTPVASKLSTTSRTPVSPQFGAIIRTPVAPSLGTKQTTPVQQKGPVVDKSLTQPPLFGLKGQNLGIVSGDDTHKPVPGTTSKIPYLYHGSVNPIPAGEKVKAGGPMSKDYAFATGDLSTAGMYAKNRSYESEREKQPALFGIINKVEPANPKSTYKDTTPHGKNTDTYISREGFVSKGPEFYVDYKGNISSMDTVNNRPSTSPMPARTSLSSPLSRSNEFKQGTMFTLSESGFRPRI